MASAVVGMNTILGIIVFRRMCFVICDIWSNQIGILLSWDGIYGGQITAESWIAYLRPVLA